MCVLWIARREQFEVGIVIVGIDTGGHAAVSAIQIGRGRAAKAREPGTLPEGGAGAQPDLVDDRVVGECQRQAAVVGDACRVCLVADNGAAISRGAGVRREVIAAWSEDRAWRHREPVANPGCRIRPADLPPADVHGGGRRVEQFYELVVAAVRPSHAELINDNTSARLRAKTRLIGHGHEHQRRSDRRGNEQPFDHRTSRAGN